MEREAVLGAGHADSGFTEAESAVAKCPRHVPCGPCGETQAADILRAMRARVPRIATDFVLITGIILAGGSG
jgi:hypothetical protein